MSAKHAILIDGTIGVGKSTMAHELSRRFDGAFLDGDDFKARGLPWYCSSLSTCCRIRDAGISALSEKAILFIARPVRCLDWIYFKRHFQRQNIRVFSIGLQADFANITHEDRGRSFSANELDRMAVMIREGYGARPYSDIHLRTDQHDIEDTAALASRKLRQLLAG